MCQVLITIITDVSVAVHCLMDSEMSWLIINCYVIEFFRFYPLISYILRKNPLKTLQVMNCEKIRSNQPVPCSPECLIYNAFSSLYFSPYTIYIYVGGNHLLKCTRLQTYFWVIQIITANRTIPQKLKKRI